MTAPRHFITRNHVVCYNQSRYGALAEQLRSGLQNRVDGCNSRTCLHLSFAYEISCYLRIKEIPIGHCRFL
jgi:hypothetical protein